MTDTCEQLRKELDTAQAEVELLRMEYGRQRARCAVFMQAMAWLARNQPEHKERVQQWVKRADEAAADVQPEDFVVAKPATTGAKS